MNYFFHVILYAIGAGLLIKGIGIELFSREFWYFAVGLAMFSLSHDFRYKKIEE